MRKTGVGTRVLNFVVDTLLIFLLSYLLYKWWVFYVRYWGQPYFPFYMFFYGTLFMYYFLFESLFTRTPGKWLTITKVVTTKGERPNILHILLRSLLRLTIIDPFFIALWEKPLHDKLSRTEVIEA
ncbi:RDD family protein [Aridibaculum aurantiacum]|uniref:RDD family protein n=1 Tax=Aridibaculum aurantiacum TaxID=2810307 RepID=UPI001A976638|nr:RDD family protein [Aridibaculum aurantiacum]